MSNWKESIITSIQGIGQLHLDSEGLSTPSTIMCTVFSIDSPTTCTVIPIDGITSPISNILLVSDSTATPTFVPAIGTTVMVYVDGTGGYVAQQGGVKSMALAGNTYGGVVIVQDVVTKLNNIEKLLNAFITLFNSHTHVIAGITTGSAAVTSATPIPTENQQLILTIPSDLENTAVTHGPGVTTPSTYTAQLAIAQAAVDLAQTTLNALLAKQNGIQNDIIVNNNSGNTIIQAQLSAQLNAQFNALQSSISQAQVQLDLANANLSNVINNQ